MSMSGIISLANTQEYESWTVEEGVERKEEDKGGRPYLHLGVTIRGPKEKRAGIENELEPMLTNTEVFK